KRDVLERVEDFYPHPKNIHVVLLNKCNLKSVMCPYHSPVYVPNHTSDYLKDMKTMSKEVFEKIARYAGINQISLQFGQIEEPLMHRSLFEFISLAKSYGVPQIHVSTNGTILDEGRAEALAKSGVDSVMFSIDAAKPETYQEIRGSDLEDLEKKIC